MTDTASRLELPQQVTNESRIVITLEFHSGITTQIETPWQGYKPGLRFPTRPGSARGTWFTQVELDGMVDREVARVNGIIGPDPRIAGAQPLVTVTREDRRTVSTIQVTTALVLADRYAPPAKENPNV